MTKHHKHTPFSHRNDDHNLFLTPSQRKEMQRGITEIVARITLINLDDSSKGNQALLEYPFPVFIFPPMPRPGVSCQDKGNLQGSRAPIS